MESANVLGKRMVKAISDQEKFSAIGIKLAQRGTSREVNVNVNVKNTRPEGYT